MKDRFKFVQRVSAEDTTTVLLYILDELRRANALKYAELRLQYGSVPEVNEAWDSVE